LGRGGVTGLGAGTDTVSVTSGIVGDSLGDPLLDEVCSDCLLLLGSDVRALLLPTGGILPALSPLFELPLGRVRPCPASVPSFLFV
jgi:hypothetical protein